VQGYVYAARHAASVLAQALGLADRAGALREQAEGLRDRFEDSFWSDEMGTYVLALDGDKQPCAVRTSNAGHCLWTGIADPERARRAAATMVSADSFSGWGIRTVASCEARYNPMSYHNGSIWPHDNAVIAAGFARYGLTDLAARAMTGLFDASVFLELARLPELFCGFRRRPGEGPTLYPVACSPQAWASGAVFMLLQSSLGLAVDAPRGRIVFRRPLLPAYLERVTLSGLSVGNAVVDLFLERSNDDVSVTARRLKGDVEIVTIK
jgi:glycogen debranching enzyme